MVRAAPGGRDTQLVDVDSDDAADSSAVEVDPGMARAGAAAAARRRELDISQRSLAADGIINAGALISFEKGRSWPRERTRAKLEEVLKQIDRCAPIANALTKEVVMKVGTEPLSSVLDFAADKFAEARRGPEAGEGLRAFAEKRPPKWVTE